MNAELGQRYTNAANAVWDALHCRKGFGQLMDEIDDDVVWEIITELAAIIKHELEWLP